MHMMRDATHTIMWLCDRALFETLQQVASLGLAQSFFESQK
jgi:hypothetical protein